MSYNNACFDDVMYGKFMHIFVYIVKYVYIPSFLKSYFLHQILQKH